MKSGEYWQHKKGEPTLRLHQYMGSDVWECIDMDHGDTADLRGSFIYDNYNKVREPRHIENLNLDWDMYNNMI